MSSRYVNENTFSSDHSDWEARKEEPVLNSAVSSEENELYVREDTLSGDQIKSEEEEDSVLNVRTSNQQFREQKVSDGALK